MSRVFAATLGQRPEAVTHALDLLLQRERVESVVIIHTDPVASKIADALASLRAVLAADYAGLPARFYEVRVSANAPLLDITDSVSAGAYFQGVYNILRELKNGGAAIDLLISGGRKAMSIYAMQAAALLSGPHDRVWTVLTPESMMRRGQFHAQPGDLDAIQLVGLPLITARLAPGQAPENAHELLIQLADRRSEFLNKLSRSERDVVDAFAQYYMEGNGKIARVLNKSERTVENQLRTIYVKLVSFYGLGERVSNKRQLLLNLILGRG